MTTVNTHIIRKAVLKMACTGDTDGFLMQQKTADWCHSELLLSLQKHMEQYDYLTDVISLDKIEITVDAGKDNWENTAIPAIIEQVEKQIKAKLGNVATAEGISLIQREHHILELLTVYLETGIMQWNSNAQSRQAFRDELDAVLVAGTTMPSVKKQHLADVLRHESAQKRLALLTDTPQVFKLSVLLSKAEPELYTEWQQAVIYLKQFQLYQRSQASKRINTDKIFISAVLSANAHSAAVKHLQHAYALLLKNLLPAAGRKAIQMPPAELPAYFAEVVKTYIASVAELHTDKTDSKPSDKTDKPVKRQKNIDSGDVKKQALTEQEMQQLLKEAFSTRSEDGQSESQEAMIASLATDGIFINNAGLVLAAPFFTGLFNNCNLVKDFQLINTDIAVCLAGYLACGNTQMAEFELVLPKLLCGVPLSKDVDTGVLLSSSMKHEAGEMLRSLIEHWSILKDTSVEGLQESFLKREGKLTFANNEWLLQVEQKGYDMLLQQIPWNYSWIKLPWMPHILKTEWVGIP